MKSTSTPGRIGQLAASAAEMVAAVAAVLAIVGCGDSPPPPSEARVLSAKHAAMLGDPPAPPKLDLIDVDHKIVAAIERAENDIRENGDSAAAWGKLGMILMAHEFGDPAAACLAQAEFLQPDEPQWPFFQAVSVLSFRPHEAVGPMERAAKLLPVASSDQSHDESVNGWPPSSRSDSPRSDDTATSAASEQALEVAGVHLRLLELYLELDRYEDAEKPLREFLAYDPQNGRAHLIAARIALRTGRFDECLREVELAGYQRPVQKPFHELRAEAFGRLGRKKEAESERRMAAMALKQGWPGPYDDEIEEVQTGLKIELEMAERWYANGRPEASIDVLEGTVQDYPQSDWAWIFMGRAQIKLRRLDEAEQSLSKALAIAPYSVDALFRMSVVHMLRSNYEEAATWTQKVLDHKPDHAVALYNMGLYAQKLHEPDRTIAYLRKAVEIEPRYFEALRQLGDVLAKKGQTDEARKFLEQARDLRPTDRWVLNRLYHLPPPRSPKPVEAP